MPLRLQAAGLTDRGRRRDVNEDAVYEIVVENPSGDAMGLLIVADGIGGRLAGEVASYWAVETIKNSLADLYGLTDPRETAQFSTAEINDALAAQNDPRETARLKRDQILDAQNVDWTEQTYFANRVRAAINRANSVVREYASQKLEGAAEIGTTISVAVVFGTDGLVANVGDSRTYLLRQGQLRQITRDHSYVQRLIDNEYIKEEERYTHPHRHLIYRSLGTKEQVETDIFSISLLPGDFLLLCTDGLWEMIQHPSEIIRIIQQAPSVEKACEGLVAAANAAGGQDNIGVVLAQALG
jgi:serine/threonine protein phosphatase PrpC